MPRAEQRTRLILDLRAPADWPGASQLLEGGNIACALLAGRANSPELQSTVQTLQENGVAALIVDDIAVAHSVGADGVHLSAGADLVTRFQTARDHLPDNHIVGVEAAPDDRHSLMVLAEDGVDYVAFNVPDNREELMWWAEIFEVPCIALGEMSPDEAKEFAGQGVEFLSVLANVDVVEDIEGAIADVHWPEA